MMQSTLKACVLVIWLLALASGGAAQTEQVRSVRDGVFTEVQAERGEKLYDDVCIACHIPEWFTGMFLDSWHGAPVSALYELISTTMPEDRPGGLRKGEYADVLAYIFRLNGLPPGVVELESQKRTLEQILIEWRE